MWTRSARAVLTLCIVAPASNYVERAQNHGTGCYATVRTALTCRLTDRSRVPPRRRAMKRTMILSTAMLLLALFVAADAQAPTPFKRTVLQQGDLSAPG